MPEVRRGITGAGGCSGAGARRAETGRRGSWGRARAAADEETKVDETTDAAPAEGKAQDVAEPADGKTGGAGPLVFVAIFGAIFGSLVAANDSPENARAAIGVLRPLFTVYTLLFLGRIVMTWYPALNVRELPLSILYLPTEPVLRLTRAFITPVGGVDVSPIVWLAFISFANEILLGPQGLLVLLSNKQ